MRFQNKVVLLMLVLALSLGLTLTAYSQDEPPIKLLGTISFSGAASNLGPAYDKAMRLAVEEINQKGLDGFSKIQYKSIDIKTKPSVFRRKLRREVMTWNPDVASGSALETTIRVPCSDSPEHNLPYFVGGHLSMSKYISPGEVPLTDWVAYYGYSDFFAGQFAAQFFHKQGVEKVAFVGGDYDWGYSNSIGFRYYWEKHGRPFEISPVIYTPLDKTDYSTEIQRLKEEEPDAIFCPYTGAGWMSLAKQARSAGAMPDIFLYGTTYSNMGGAKVTGEYGAKNIYTLADHNPETEEWANFVKRWKEKYGEEAYPPAYANNYYQGVYWLAKVFEKAGTKDPRTIIETMKNTSFKNVCISPMGPMGPKGSNMGAKGAIVKFEEGSSELDPSFDLHPVLAETYEVPDKTSEEVLQTMEGWSKLKAGKDYPKSE